MTYSNDEKEVLAFINSVVKAEKGNQVLYSSSLRDTALDSFGYTVLMLELDDKYNYFSDVPEGTDIFSTVEWDVLTIKDIIGKCIKQA